MVCGPPALACGSPGRRRRRSACRFPLRIARKPGLTVAGVACRRRSALGFAPHGEPFHERAIETDIELLRPAHAHDVVLHCLRRRTLISIAIDWEKSWRTAMPPRDPNGRSSPAGRPARRSAELHTSRVPLEAGRPTASRVTIRATDRYRSRCAVEIVRTSAKVKAAIGGLVARQQRPHVQIDGEKVTDCVVVFSSIQTMNGIDAAGFGLAAHARSISVSSQPATA